MADPTFLFSAGILQAVELDASAVPALQRLYEDNPGYFIAYGGRPPQADEAARAFAEGPPLEFGGSRRTVLGWYDGGGRLAGVADVSADLFAQGVWHIAFFLLADAWHGSGAARTAYAGLEGWATAQGARWMRLGVVEENGRAACFWERCGFREVRRRAGVPLGQRVHVARVMVKPLGGAGMDDYLALVARDRPQA